ncbi:MAG: HNH endonuclease [Flavobacteriaceae bacterium]|nr:HNH endonuclease [Flavobacteriaceae bacterium]
MSNDKQHRNKQKNKRKKIWCKYNNRCAYCGKKLAYKNMTLDHIKAKSKEGKSTYRNLNPCCKSCNNLKANLSLNKFRKIIIKRNNIFKSRKGKFYFEK